MFIQTERLTLSPVRPDDWQGLQEIILDFQKSPCVMYDHPMPTEASEVQALAGYFAESGLFFSVHLHERPDMIGYICLHPDGEQWDLGYCFHSAWHGHGYALEGCSALMAHFARHYPISAFTAGTALANTPSCRLLQRLGFVLKETAQVSFHKDEAGRDITFEGGSFIKYLHPRDGCKT